jgi:hypothetical protein
MRYYNTVFINEYNRFGPDATRLLMRIARRVRLKLRKLVDKRRKFVKAMAAKTVCCAVNLGAGVARGLHLNFGVTDNHHVRWRSVEFPQNRFAAHRT